MEGNGEVRNCLNCGAEFELDIRRKKKFCCLECRNQFRKNNESYREHARIMRHQRWIYHKKLYCIICGNPIDRDTHEGTSRMHEQCLIDDVLGTLRSGDVLSQVQTSRIYSHGHTTSEMIDIMYKEIEATQKEKNIVTRAEAAAMFNVPIPRLDAMILRNEIRIYNSADYKKGYTRCRTFVNASELEVYLKKKNVNRKKKLKWVDE